MKALFAALAFVVLVAPAAHAGPVTKSVKFVAVHAAKGVAKVAVAAAHVAAKV